MITLGCVFRRFADGYLSAHAGALLPSHARAIADILACRTPAEAGGDGAAGNVERFEAGLAGDQAGQRIVRAGGPDNRFAGQHRAEPEARRLHVAFVAFEPCCHRCLPSLPQSCEPP